MKRTLMMTTAIVILSGSLALAAPITGEQKGQEYIEKGYDRVEVKVGPTQIKVEAIRDGIETEVIFDAATGKELKSETGAADEDDTRPGLFIETEDEDFLSADDDGTLDDDMSDEDDLSDEDTGTDDDSADDSADDDADSGDDDSDDSGDDDNDDNDDSGDDDSGDE